MKRPAAAPSKRPAAGPLKRPAARPLKRPATGPVKPIATSETQAPLQIVFAASAEHGHNTPMLALAHELHALAPDVKLYWACDSKEKRVAESVGAEWVPLEYYEDQAVGGGRPAPARMMYMAVKHFETFSEWLCRVKPSVVIYDYFCIVAPLACQKIGVPYVCFRSGQPSEEVDTCPEPFREGQKLQAQLLKERFDLQVDWHAPFVELLSPMLNIFQVPLVWLGTSRGRYEPCATIGPSIVPRPLSLEDEQLLAALDAPGCSFKVYISMGTVVGSKNIIKDRQALFQMFANVAKLLPEARVVLSVSGTEGVVDVEEIDTPDNCLIRKFIPQLAVLQRVQAFLSHCGANSMHEALWAGVPVLGVPVFGDQLGNAKRLEENGWGKQRRHDDLNAEMIAKDIKELATSPEYRKALGQAKELERDAIASRRPVTQKILRLAEKILLD